MSHWWCVTLRFAGSVVIWLNGSKKQKIKRVVRHILVYLRICCCQQTIVGLHCTVSPQETTFIVFSHLNKQRIGFTSMLSYIPVNVQMFASEYDC